MKPRIQVSLTKTRIQYLVSAIHDVESRIQDCLGFPFMGRMTIDIHKNTKKMWRYLPCTKPKNIFSSCISRLDTKVTARVNIQSKWPRRRPVAINCILCTRALHFDPYGDCQACAMDAWEETESPRTPHYFRLNTELFFHLASRILQIPLSCKMA